MLLAIAECVFKTKGFHRLIDICFDNHVIYLKIVTNVL